ncbi:hypothetical protein GOP47_0017421 [Adiantum capillus-veneris]|uniref:Uncharacterized protein n=1 Tax=Adiantum capillus-veneris TaxID=13818 RepID=A0A9D4Z957_ADICA|nr:hypothetical protein GOP47_0017421 [Adiantum capillus-veneris]
MLGAGGANFVYIIKRGNENPFFVKVADLCRWDMLVHETRTNPGCPTVQTAPRHGTSFHTPFLLEVRCSS